MNLSKMALTLLGSCAMSLACDAMAGQSLFNFRTTPASVSAGAPFTVDADSNPCYVLFVGTHDGVDYGGVSIVGNVIEVRYGYYQTPVCDSPTGVISQNVPALPPGSHEVRAILQPFVPGGPEFVESTFGLQVPVPSSAPHSIPSLGWLGATLCGLLVAAVGLSLVRRRQRT